MERVSNNNKYPCREHRETNIPIYLILIYYNIIINSQQNYQNSIINEFTLKLKTLKQIIWIISKRHSIVSHKTIIYWEFLSGVGEQKSCVSGLEGGMQPAGKDLYWFWWQIDIPAAPALANSWSQTSLPSSAECEEFNWLEGTALALPASRQNL